MPTYKNGTVSDLVIDGIGFLAGEEKTTGKYLRKYPTTGVGYIATCSVAAGGSGYTDEDVLTIDDGSDATFEATVANGAVTSLTMLTTGYGYTAGDDVTTTYDGDGTGCKVDITVTPFGVVDDEPIITPYKLVVAFEDLPGTSYAQDVSLFDTIHVYNGTDEVAYVVFNGADLDKFYLEVGERYDFDNYDQRIGSLKVSGTADTGAIYVFGGGSYNTPSEGG